MKNSATKLFLAIAAVCVTGTALNAQSYKMGVNIPFAFQVGKTIMPAGKYAAQKPVETQVESLISPSGKRIAVAIASPLTDPQRQARLVFHRYGTECFLAEVWNGEGTGARLTPTKEERDAKGALAANNAEDVTVFMGSLR